MIWFSAAVEGLPDEAVARKLLTISGYEIKLVKNCRGKSALDEKLPGYNEAAKFGNWIILRDLDHDASCGPELRNCLLAERSPKMHLRIVIRSIESWLLGDRERFAHFLGVYPARLARNPEALDNPKQEVLALAQRSRKRAIRDDMLPRENSNASEGPAYASRLAEFIETDWCPESAAVNCNSLHRCLRHLIAVA